MGEGTRRALQRNCLTLHLSDCRVEGQTILKRRSHPCPAGCPVMSDPSSGCPRQSVAGRSFPPKRYFGIWAQRARLGGRGARLPATPKQSSPTLEARLHDRPGGSAAQHGTAHRRTRPPAERGEGAHSPAGGAGRNPVAKCPQREDPPSPTRSPVRPERAWRGTDPNTKGWAAHPGGGTTV